MLTLRKYSNTGESRSQSRLKKRLQRIRRASLQCEDRHERNGTGNRYSPLKQITRENVSSLKLKWVIPIPYFGLEVTPIAADGMLYVTGPNQVFALDALTGDPLWQYSHPPTPGLVGDSRLGTNRGVAILRDKVFFVTDNAHLLSLDRGSGKLLWETPLAWLSPASR